MVWYLIKQWENFTLIYFTLLNSLHADILMPITEWKLSTTLN